MPVQRPHNADPREHRWPITFCNQKQRFHRGLPFRRIMFCLGQLGDVERGVRQRLTLGQRDWFGEFLIPRHKPLPVARRNYGFVGDTITTWAKQFCR